MESSKKWSFAQTFDIRVSTMLYIWAVFIWIVCIVFPPDQQSNSTLGSVLAGLEGAAYLNWIIAPVFGLTFLLDSLFKKNPQVQYLIESLLGIVLILFPIL